MELYNKFILHKVQNYVLSGKPIMHQRKKVVPNAAGRVLEIGFGSGLNLPFYDSSKVNHVWALEPSMQMRKLAKSKINDIKFNLEFVELSGDKIQLESNCADTILLTYTLCTIPNVQQALDEMRRILKPRGKLIFCEHGLAPDEKIRKWQNRINPTWKALGGGCNLNRPIPSLIGQGGFKIKNIDTMYISSFKPASFNYWGTAVQK